MKLKKDQGDNKRILVFTDPHAPYHHKDTLKFLTNVKREYKPDTIICTGDLLDGYNASNYTKDPDHPHTAADELELVREFIRSLGKLFPKMVITWGNHDARHTRALKNAGISTEYLKSVEEVFEMPSGWIVTKECSLVVKVKGRPTIKFKHYSGANSMMEAERAGCCYVQGHAHKKANIQWTSNGHRLIFGMNVPPLISDEGCPYSYDSLSNQRPVRGCAVIINAVPTIIPLDGIGW